MSTQKDATTVKVTTVATINNTKIVLIEDGEQRVAVRPICDALGIAYEPQFTRLKTDPILGSTVTLNVMVGADQKEREMVTIPFKYVFGWLFRIDSRNVKEEARESVLRYQMECYDALYNHFRSYADYVNHRATLIEEAASIKDAIRHEFNTAKERLKEADEKFREAIRFNYADWLESKAQLQMHFPEHNQKGGL
jgi:hypothetical protein